MQHQSHDAGCRFFRTLVVFLALGTLVAGCRESEQSRILQYEKGTYLGQADSALADDAVQSLQLRTRAQRAP